MRRTIRSVVWLNPSDQAGATPRVHGPALRLARLGQNAQAPLRLVRFDRRGFSVIELLVASCLLLLLLTLLLPVFGKIRYEARMVKCLSNLHQVAGAIKSYEADHGRMPLHPYEYMREANPEVGVWPVQVKSDSGAGQKVDTRDMYKRYMDVDKFSCPFVPGWRPSQAVAPSVYVDYVLVPGYWGDFDEENRFTTVWTRSRRGINYRGVEMTVLAGDRMFLDPGNGLHWVNHDYGNRFGRVTQDDPNGWAASQCSGYTGAGVDQRAAFSANYVFADGHASRFMGGDSALVKVPDRNATYRGTTNFLLPLNQTAVWSSGPRCDGVTPTIYVGDNNRIVGGPNNGSIFAGVLNGTDGDDVIVAPTNKIATIYGKGGNDIICGGNSTNIINVTGGDNYIDTGGGNNTITTGPGNDTIVCGDGNDIINAGDGHNTIHAGNGSNTVNTGNGNDTIYGGSGTDIITCSGGNNYIVAGDGANTINTGGGNDNIYTGSGNDIINSGAGNDLIFAGEGNNAVNAGAGNDIVFTGSGTDVINGGPGNDTITSTGGNNTITGGQPGVNTINPGPGNNIINP